MEYVGKRYQTNEDFFVSKQENGEQVNIKGITLEIYKVNPENELVAIETKNRNRVLIKADALKSFEQMIQTYLYCNGCGEDFSIDVKITSDVDIPKETTCIFCGSYDLVMD